MRRRRTGGTGGGGKVTIFDVANEVGVSAQTVSRVLGRPELVAEQTRRKVIEAIAALGYIPNEAARNLASNSSRTVAVIIPTLASSVYAAQVSQIIRTLETRGISVVIGNSEYSYAREEQLVRSLLERRPVAVILTGVHHAPGVRDLLRASDVPVIETWDIDSEPIDCAVGFSNVAASREVGRLFAARGSTRVAFVGGRSDQDPRATSRYRGLTEGLAEAGLPAPFRVEIELPMATQDGIKGLDMILSDAPMTDAILFSADFLALAALLECNRRGIKVPEQLALCGFGDYDLTPLVSPALTTVRIYPEEMGRRAAELVLQRLDGEASGQRLYDVGHKLVRRGSA